MSLTLIGNKIKFTFQERELNNNKNTISIQLKQMNSLCLQCSK